MAIISVPIAVEAPPEIGLNIASGIISLGICNNFVIGEGEVIYTFGKDLEVKQLKITLPEDNEISSITSIFPCAFIYENEMHDLFGVKIKMINIDYEGKLYRTAIETPFK